MRNLQNKQEKFEALKDALSLSETLIFSKNIKDTTKNVTLNGFEESTKYVKKNGGLLIDGGDGFYTQFEERVLGVCMKHKYFYIMAESIIDAEIFAQNIQPDDFFHDQRLDENKPTKATIIPHLYKVYFIIY